MKTAISIPDDVFEEISQAAEEDNISRSKLFTDAVRRYLEYRKNQKLLSELNKAYSENESKEEIEVRKRSKRYYANKIAREKW
ncbi:ribbon-helix-helix protein, CopG family [bacterium]|nr:ribbon-helix-helix protein, CopG family [bacterium]MCI0614723.1 ribbon-helix-helix protein, CopG family [bacterium]